MSESRSSSGIGFTGLLQVAFIVLKLTHYIEWSWWLVLVPTWISIAIVLVLIFIAGLLEIYDNRKLWRKR